MQVEYLCDSKEDKKEKKEKESYWCLMITNYTEATADLTVMYASQMHDCDKESTLWRWHETASNALYFREFMVGEV